MNVSAPLNLLVTCPAGIEALLAAEITGLGAAAVRERHGGVETSGELELAYRVCLWSRLASRVLLPLTHYPAADPEALYQGALAVDWSALFDVDRSFAIEVAGHSPTLTHSGFAALKVKDAVADRFREVLGRRPNVDTADPDIRIHLHLDRDAVTLSLDLSGDSLHRRGYRTGAGEAPLKENLAAAILVRAGWPAIAAQGGALIDPLCGSGTLVIEAALMAGDAAPGLTRERVGFEAWSAHQPAVWKALCWQAAQRRTQGLARLPPLRGADLDRRVLERARQNALAAGLSDQIQWVEADLSSARPIGTLPGLLVTNPPYGERLGVESEVIKLYSLLGATLKSHFPGWSAAVFTSRPDLSPRLGLRAKTLHSLYNGRIACKLLCFELASAPEGALMAPEPGEFGNRLAKNLRHLRKWARRSDVSNYRLYDADLPAYALSIDLFEAEQRHVHVNEYAAPADIDPVAAERRLREALAQIQSQLEVPASHIHFKQRRSQKGHDQYQRQAHSQAFVAIQEHGTRLWANFDDYLDAGLFLDHRPLRLRIQREARGKRFLNLFCYTATASVQAAMGGAAATVSIDLSNTYLDWAQRNFTLNGFSVTLDDGRRESAERAARATHLLRRGDCLAWLREQAELPNPQRFDLILCDPPTFSNSKRMEDILDVQRDHVEMIRHAAKLLAPGGILYFSTNRRRFKLDESALGDWIVEDITRLTLDEDYKRPPPAHRCWRIRGPG